MAIAPSVLTMPQRPQPTQADAAIQRDLVSRVESALGARARTIGPLTRNYFSILFPLDLDEGRRLMIKVAKTDLRDRPDAGLAPATLTDGDRRLGAAEYASLTALRDRWPAAAAARWVTPVMYEPDFNAIVTERIDAMDVCVPYRRLALRQRLGAAEPGRHLERVMSSIGGALGEWHRTEGRPAVRSGSAMGERLAWYADRIARMVGSDSIFSRTQRVAARVASEQWETLDTSTLKGVDIRNVLEAPDGRVWLLDPGKIKQTAREADLARFLLTWRILFWGSPWFLLRASPHHSSERAFLDAYWQGAAGNRRIGAAYEMKEVLKHWLTALESLALKSVGQPAVRMIRAMYIHPFYRSQLEQQLRVLE